ncbi:hypothetical protein HDU88_007090 [Geranomyces variabilis]|nr:hypothetical protein HDU88_007090 [Geranomyces variabilis]
MPTPPATAANIVGFSAYTLAIAIGVSNTVYTIRSDLVGKAWAPRNTVNVLGLLLILVSSALSFKQGYDYEVAEGRNRAGRTSDAFFFVGSYLMIMNLQPLLPAVQLRLNYNERWNTLLIATNFLCFALCFVGWLTTTIIITVRDDDSPDVQDMRALCFTIWAAYAPLMLILISIVVCRMIIASKRTLAAAMAVVPEIVESGDEDQRGAAVVVLDTIRKRAVASAVICIPLTIAVAGYTSGPFSACADGIATMYTDTFCAWLLYNIYVIRQVVLYTPSSRLSHASAPRGKRLAGMAAVRASNSASHHGKTPEASGGY